MLPQFQEVRTRRLKASYSELTVGQSLALSSLPPESTWRSIREFLSYVVTLDGVNSVQELTVPEQNLLLCQYLSALSPHPDFELSQNGHYSDYLNAAFDVELDGERQLKVFDLGIIGDDHWQISYLTGGMAEAIERLQGEVKLPNNHVVTELQYWELGCMAAMLSIVDQPILNPYQNEGAYDEQLLHRMNVFLNYPQSIFRQLRTAFYSGWVQLDHLFSLGLNNKGIVVMPREVGSTLPPARFRVSAIIPASIKGLAASTA
ncbi:hypothetical protein [Methylocucumis oryzae]|uniref:Uncharacterized protein n=1 Tax=Methylocucumis oryzae TaxID=1632867 RepID=A0A0F3IN42_9GAMM|nr:hypothetical protein [Methylocucumis oryzae]KJV08062.1 hypothetical protein VZ94_00440 [Methylocucumis oryzae]